MNTAVDGFTLFWSKINPISLLYQGKQDNSTAIELFIERKWQMWDK